MGMNHKSNPQMRSKKKEVVKLSVLFSCQLPFGSDLKVRDILSSLLTSVGNSGFPQEWVNKLSDVSQSYMAGSEDIL